MTLVEKILEILQSQAENTADLFYCMMCDRSTSYKRLRRSMKYGPREFKTNWADVYKKRQQFYTMLNYLKNEGLVGKEKDGRSSLWQITRHGLEHLKTIKQVRSELLYARNADFPQIHGDGFTIVSFDIPERERKKRDWVRACLEKMGFTFLQKSVWFGKGKITEKFIHALRERKMLDYIHIFLVSRTGTLRKIGEKR